MQPLRRIRTLQVLRKKNSPAEIQEGTLEAQITLNDTRKTLEGNWSVNVPLRMIRYE